MSQMVHTLSEAKKQLLGANTESDEYHIALDLQKNNPDAYALMNISIHYPDDVINSTLRYMDEVFTFWAKGTEYRKKHWRSIIPALEKLKPYLEKPDVWNGNPVKTEINKIKITVLVMPPGKFIWSLKTLTLLRVKLISNCK